MNAEVRVIQESKPVVVPKPKDPFKAWLRERLPEAQYEHLRNTRLWLKHTAFVAVTKHVAAAWYGLLASNGFLAGLYYAFGSRAYDREHKGTLAARAKFLKDVFTGEGNIYLLRRNVHRVEKALTMKPRRDLFALGFIEETVSSYVDCMQRLATGRLHDRETMIWAHQVLSEYFSVVRAHKIVRKCRAMFDSADPAILDRTDDTSRIPFVRQPPADLPSFDSLMQLALHRRACRWFDDRPVPRELIDKAVVLAGLSPSACNRQPFKFMIFDDPQLCQEVAAIPRGTPGWLHSIPCFIVIVGTLEAFDGDQDRHVPYIDGCLAAMSLQFALETLGISSCCVNWPDLAATEAQMTKKLGLKPYERPIMNLAIGYPDTAEKVPFSQKLPLDELRIYNHVPAQTR